MLCVQCTRTKYICKTGQRGLYCSPQLRENFVHRFSFHFRWTHLTLVKYWEKWMKINEKKKRRDRRGRTNSICALIGNWIHQSIFYYLMDWSRITNAYNHYNRNDCRDATTSDKKPSCRLCAIINLIIIELPVKHISVSWHRHQSAVGYTA